MQGTKSGAFKNFLYSQKVTPYVFVAPFLITFLLFFLYPVYSTIVMSFQEITFGETKFIGFNNYERLSSKIFYTSLWNSTAYTLFILLVLIPFPMVLAVLLNAKFTIWKSVFRSALFIPALISVVVSGVIFRMMFAEVEGALINQVVGFFGIAPVRWLFSWDTGMLSLVLLATWRWAGVNLLYFLAGLQNIPQEVYESADIDGTNMLQKFWYITVPMLKPITIYVLTISIFGGLSMFVESYMLWGGNVSPNDIGLTVVGYLYRVGFEQFNLGFASTVGITLLAITLTINFIQLRFFGLFRKED